MKIIPHPANFLNSLSVADRKLANAEQSKLQTQERILICLRFGIAKPASSPSGLALKNYFEAVIVDDC